MFRTKAFFILCLLIPVSVSAQVSVDSIKNTLSAFSAAVKAKDMALIQESVAEDFAIHTDSWPSAAGLLDIILNNQSVESVELLSEEVQHQEDYVLADARISLSDGKQHESKIAFDQANKILFVDHFDRLFGSSRFRESVFVGTLPFEQEGLSIILKLRLNESDRWLRFLLDTGADGMAIRKSLADSLGVAVSHSQNAHVVGGQQQIEISRGNRVHLSDSVVLNDQNMALFPEVGHGVDGIIGLNLMRRYVVHVHYDRREIDLYSFGNREWEGMKIPVATPHSLISLPCRVNLLGDKELSGHVIMDTGADYYLILFSQFVRKNRLLLSGFKPESQAATVSLGISTPVYNGKAAEFRLGDGFVDRNIPITLQASTGSDRPRPGLPDGSLGIGFFGRFNFTIDLLGKHIYLIERQ